jgi:hypothetical protein
MIDVVSSEPDSVAMLSLFLLTLELVVMDGIVSDVPVVVVGDEFEFVVEVMTLVVVNALDVVFVRVPLSAEVSIVVVVGAVVVATCVVEVTIGVGDWVTVDVVVGDVVVVVAAVVLVVVVVIVVVGGGAGVASCVAQTTHLP